MFLQYKSYNVALIWILVNNSYHSFCYIWEGLKIRAAECLISLCRGLYFLWQNSYCNDIGRDVFCDVVGHKYHFS